MPPSSHALFHRSTGWRLTALALMASAAHGTAGAQSLGDEPTSMTPQLREVVVTGRRSLEDRFFSTGSLVVVDRQDIEDMGVETVTDVLRQLPGVQVTPNASGSVDIRMRGMDASATRVLVDGQRSSGRSQLPFDQLPAELIERIEVIRAPSAEFSGASGGTINFVLRQGSAKREGNLRLSASHVDSRNAGGLFLSHTGPLPSSTPPAAANTPEAAKPPTWTYFMGLAGGGFLSSADSQRITQGGTNPQSSESQTRNRREEWTLLPRLNGRLSAKDQVALRGTLTTSALDGRYTNQALVGTGVTSPNYTNDERTDQGKQYRQGAMDWTRRLEGSKLESSFSANRLAEDVTRTGQTISSSGVSNTVFQDQRTESAWSLKSKLTGTQTSLLWMVGAEVESRHATANTQRSNDSPASQSSEQLSADIQRQVLWGQNEWSLPLQTTLTAGLRGESILLRTTNASLPASQRLSFLQPSLHTRTPISDNLQWRSNLARITRNPNIWDLVDRSVPSQGANAISNPDQLGNPNLRPEVALTLDTGLERRLPRQGQMGFNLFVRQLDDVMARRTSLVNGRWVDQRQNIGSATAWGLEADIKQPLAGDMMRGWNLSASGSLLQSRMSDGPDAGLRIPGQARYVANVSVNKPLRRAGGPFGGMTVSLNGPSSLSTGTQQGREQARLTLDVFGGSVIPKVGFWRLGVYNLSNARMRRELQYTQGLAAVTESTSTTLAPRIYLSFGTQF